MNSGYIKALTLATTIVEGIVAIFDRLLRFSVAFGAASIMFAIIFHVVGRYFFGKTYMGTMELIRYTMIWVSLLGAVLAFRSREHVKVSLFRDILSRRNLLRLKIFANLVLIVFLGAMIVGGIEISIRNMAQTSLGLQIPMGYPYAVIPLSGFFMIIYVLANILERMTNLSTLED